MLTEEQQRRRPWQLQQQTGMTSSTSSEMKRVAWPPAAPNAGSFEIIDTNDNNDYGPAGNDPKLDQQRQQQQQQYHQFTAANKKAPPVPPKPGAGHEQHQARLTARQNSLGYSATNSTQIQQDEAGSEGIDMSTNNKSEPFASIELVGERKLIAKPPPPSGLVLGRPLKTQAPYSQEPQAVYSSESFFKRGSTPVRMLGDMVWPPKGSAGGSTGTVQSPGLVRRQAKDYRGFFNQHQLPANFPTYRAPPGTQHFGLEEGENATAM